MKTPSADANWKPRGTMHAWRYLASTIRRRRPGWHLTFDAAACDSMTELLEKMGAANTKRQRTLPLAQVTPEVLTVLKRKRAFKPRGLSAFKLIYEPAAEPEHWRLEERENTLELEMGKASLEEFASAVAAVRLGEGDFALGDPPLRFWWYPRG
jgi:hypothetical protein